MLSPYRCFYMKSPRKLLKSGGASNSQYIVIGLLKGKALLLILPKSGKAIVPLAPTIPTFLTI